MKKIPQIIFCCGLLLLTSLSCGRKGPLQAPVPHIPQEIKDFKVEQRGKKLLFSWTEPVSYLSGQPLEIAFTEILAIEEGERKGEKKIREEDFLKLAKPLALMGLGQLEIKKGQAELRLEADKISEKNLIIGIRVKGKKGGWSKISNLVSITPHLLPGPPERLKAEVSEDKISLSWQPPEFYFDGKTKAEVKGYNIYRSTDGDFKKINEDLLKSPSFEDRNFSFGQSYRYLVRAIAGQGEDLREGEDSEILEILAKDVFAPKTPAEIQAMVSEEGVRISWLPNGENDLAGYKVYRQKDDEEAKLLTPEPITTPFFLDNTVENKITYIYSITAVDKAGNESAPGKIQVKT
jgi:predicted small lipoprotein YifL